MVKYHIPLINIYNIICLTRGLTYESLKMFLGTSIKGRYNLRDFFQCMMDFFLNIKDFDIKKCVFV